jgi:hypothetical protein
VPLKPRRKPLPAWLVIILALIAVVVVGAVIASAVFDSSGHHEGMPETANGDVTPGASG